jgi:hypothetical protein
MSKDESVTTGTDSNTTVPNKEGEKPDVVAPAVPSKATTVDNNEDLTGLKKNRDDLLAEKQSLKAKYDALVTANEERETKSLEEQNRFQDLYKKSEDKIKELKTTHKAEIEKLKAEHEASTGKYKTQLERIQKLNTFNTLATQHGFNIEYSSYHYQDAELKWKSDDNGGISLGNPDDYFKSLKEKRPSLFMNQPTVKTDATKTTPFGTKDHIFTRQEIKNMSIEEYKKNKDAIMAQEKAGLNYGEGK